MQQFTLQGAASTPGYALEERKWASHAEAGHSVGVSFIPLVVESLGGRSEEAADTISSIGRPLGQRLGIPTSESDQHLFQECAISLWRGNASLWVHRHPVHSSAVDGLL